VLEEGYVHFSAADADRLIPGISSKTIISIKLSFISEGGVILTSPTTVFCQTPISTTTPSATTGKILVLAHFLLNNTSIGCIKAMDKVNVECKRLEACPININHYN